MEFVISSTHGSFYVEAQNAEAARKFAESRLAKMFAGEAVTILAITERK